MNLQPHEWIGVDLDGTLAEFHGHVGPWHIGPPIPLMVSRVKEWLAKGYCVKIFTARVDGGKLATKIGHPQAPLYRDVENVRSVIRQWCVEHIGQELEITNEKDYGMVQLWDDLAIQVIQNTGRSYDGV